MVIPDTQVKPGVPLDHFTHIGRYIVKMKPQVLIHIGDHWDMPSLSSYDKKGSRQMEGRRYAEDIEWGNKAMDMLMAPIHEEVRRQRRNKHAIWKPEMHFCLGNHEQRIVKAVDADAQLETLMSFDDFNLEEHGWTVHPFLKPVMIDGVCYAHYIVSGTMGRPVSSARIGLTKRHQSFVMGHVQQRDIAFANRADGSSITGVFLGICYQHDEGYLTPQTNTDQTWSGVWVLHDVHDGKFDVMPVSLNWLRRQYG